MHEDVKTRSEPLFLTGCIVLPFVGVSSALEQVIVVLMIHDNEGDI